MKITLIAVGAQMPKWVEMGYQEYVKRLPSDYQLRLIEIPTAKRHKTTTIERIKEEEAEKILSHIPTGDLIITLEILGKQWDTITLAKHLQIWHDLGQNITLVVGGPDGLAKTVLNKANTHWSLSHLTLPHPLVRILIAEQLYRAWSLINHHPYHRP